MKQEINLASYPKYYRQRFLVTLLQYLNSSLTWTEFQKILFLSQQETEIFYYDFVFLGDGFHSFQAVSDIEVLHRLGWVEIKNNNIMRLLRKLPSEKGLAQIETQKLFRFIREKKYFKEQLLFSKNTKLYEENFANNESILFTIGYEGISFEEYINQLLRKNVRLLCDVRMNPISRKFGFSKGNLSELLPKLGIEYLHIPELGIISSSRKDLNAASDYQRLFSSYKSELNEKKKFLFLVTDALFKFKRIALTCFEQKPLFCHRHCISDYLQKEKEIKVIHL